MIDTSADPKTQASTVLNGAFKDLIIASTTAEQNGDDELGAQLNDFAMRCFRMKQVLTRKPRQPKDSK